jgi:hypothetical protein
MEISRGVTLTVRFLCELAMLAALAFWGFGAGDATSLLNEVQERRAGPETIRRR